MDPIDGVLQVSLDGDLQRVICQGAFDNAWSMQVVHSYSSIYIDLRIIESDQYLYRWLRIIFCSLCLVHPSGTRRMSSLLHLEIKSILSISIKVITEMS